MSQREILFKAKRADNGNWIQGNLIVNEITGQRMIMHVWQEHPELYDFRTVIPETVCQYTGLTDKNGKKIFEGDRVVLDKGEEYEKNGFVSYSNGVFVIQFEKTWDFLCTNLEYAEIIGNIHDN